MRAWQGRGGRRDDRHPFRGTRASSHTHPPTRSSTPCPPPARLEEKLATCQSAIRTAGKVEDGRWMGRRVLNRPRPQVAPPTHAHTRTPENNLDRVQYALTHYIEAQAKVSRKNVKLANALVIFAESEPVHLGSLLATTSGHLKALDAHRDELTSRLDHLSAAPLHHYPATLAKLRADFRAREALVRQQHKAQGTLEHHFMANDRTRVGAAQVQLERVTAQLEAATTLTLGRVEAFELQKRLDVKVCVCGCVLLLLRGKGGRGPWTCHPPRSSHHTHRTSHTGAHRAPSARCCGPRCSTMPRPSKSSPGPTSSWMQRRWRRTWRRFAGRLRLPPPWRTRGVARPPSSPSSPCPSRGGEVG